MGIETYFQLLTDAEKKHFPEKLFFGGDEDLLYEKRRVSVVGSRAASKEGLQRAKIISKTLVEHDIIVVSGLAKGIDTMAHQTAIGSGGRTIAVLGTPLNVPYPKENAALLDKIKKEHLAISQFPEGFPTQPKNFPIRNRTMALISDATIIIEATDKSKINVAGRHEIGNIFVKTSRGRIAAIRAFKHFGLKPPAEFAGQSHLFDQTV